MRWMNCRDLEKLIFSYCDNKLTPQKRMLLEKHLQKCPSCRNKMNIVVLENELIKEAADIPELSETFTGDLMMLIESRYRSIPPQDDEIGSPLATLETEKPKRGLIQARIAIVAVFLLVFMAASYLLDSEQHIEVADKTSSNTPLVPISQKQELPQDNVILKASESVVPVVESKSKEDIASEAAEQKKIQEIAGQPQQSDTLNHSKQISQPLSLPTEMAPLRLADNDIRDNQEVNRGKLTSNNTYDTEEKTLLPANLPASYQLIGANQGREEYSFTYKKVDNEAELVITIVPRLIPDGEHYPQIMEFGQEDLADDQSVTSNISTEDLSNYKDTDIIAVPADETTKVENTEVQVKQRSLDSPRRADVATAFDPLATEMQNSIKETLLINKQEYNVTFSGNLPPEELAGIAAIIDWQEVIVTTETTHP